MHILTGGFSLKSVSPQVFMTLLSILADFSCVVVLTGSILLLITSNPILVEDRSKNTH